MAAVFKNAVIIVLIYMYMVVRGSAKSRNTYTSKVVVMPASRLGDMICATPIFHAIKKQYPDCIVKVAGLENCSKVHEHNSDVDGYVSLSLCNFFEDAKKIRRIGADAAIVNTPSFYAVAMLFLAGVKTIIAPRVINGFCPYQTKSYLMIRPLIITVDHRMRYYAPLEYLSMLRPLGIHSTDTRKHIGFSDAAGQKMKDYLVKRDIIPGSDFIVGISVSAGNKIKKWPLNRFAEIANVLSSKYGAAILFIGSRDDSIEVSQVVGMLQPNIRCIDASGKCSIDELKALMALMDLFISVDTGPIYIAEALGVPTVDITGPIDENEQPPIGHFHKVVHVQDRKSPELFVMNARAYDEKEARRQTEEITVESVIAVAAELIHEIKSSK